MNNLIESLIFKMHRNSTCSAHIRISVIDVPSADIRSVVVRGAMTILSCISLLAPLQAADPPQVDEDGTIHVPAYLLPESSFLSDETRKVLKRERAEGKARDDFGSACYSGKIENPEQAIAIRNCVAEAFYRTEQYKRLRALHPVNITAQLMAGVYTEVFTPLENVTPNNEHRVLINLHGGGFDHGARWEGREESIPIASVAKIKVISIDYRQAPESRFPAASEDVAAVYQALLKSYNPKNIGIYGCSSGGALTAQAVAWIANKGLPLPGAVGMFCEGAPRSLRGSNDKLVKSDAAYFAGALVGIDNGKWVEAEKYYEGVDRNNLLASPGDHDDLMKQFPPALLISGTRDVCLSSVVATHAQLVRLGVDADLHVWEGMGHGFLTDSAMPESKEAYAVIHKFFDRHLGR